MMNFISALIQGKEVLPIENLRLIMVEQIYLAIDWPQENSCVRRKLPVIFDEMFCAFDPERLKAAVLWLTESSGRQVIISTSKKQELDVLQKTGLSVNEISL